MSDASNHLTSAVFNSTHLSVGDVFQVGSVYLLAT